MSNNPWATCPACGYTRPTHVSGGELVVRQHRAYSTLLRDARGFGQMVMCAGAESPAVIANDDVDDDEQPVTDDVVKGPRIRKRALARELAATE
jgi:hypothetical protein